MKTLCLKVLDTINRNKLLKKGNRVLVGFSGGPDSSLLLQVLSKLAEKQGFELIAVHVNYGKRKTAKRDAEFVKKICQGLNLELYLYQVKTETLTHLRPEATGSKSLKLPQQFKKITNFENQARKIRYFIFDFLLRKTNAHKIAIAHNANDQTETILFNFLRGSGLKGLGGMAFASGKIIRPLLNLPRAKIINYLKQNQIDYVLDETNLDTRYTRNRLRLELIPLLEKKFNPSLTKTLNRNALLYQEYAELVMKTAQQKLKNAKLAQKLAQPKLSSITVPWQKFKKEPWIIQAEITRELIHALNGTLDNVSQDLIMKLLTFLNKSTRNAEFSEIKKLTIKKKGDKVLFKKRC